VAHGSEILSGRYLWTGARCPDAVATEESLSQPTALMLEAAGTEWCHIYSAIDAGLGSALARSGVGADTAVVTRICRYSCTVTHCVGVFL
jgi:hypothetical protein